IPDSHTRKMKLLLLSLCLGLAWALQDFCPEQVAGPWQTIKLGATNRSVIEDGGAYLCFMTGIQILANGNLNVTYFHRKDGNCVKEYYIAEKTDIPGRYTFEYEGQIYLTFVFVSNIAAIIDLENHSESGILTVVELHGRTWFVDKQGLEAYREHTSRRGIPQRNIVNLLASRLHCTPQ
uniref:Lipocalin/cytosolic fatty-acid binding domain-containing protein n=1 Tax=Castor canadensis TaxID=51338 RepID=A0A8C0ZW53_CASCN